MTRDGGLPGKDCSISLSNTCNHTPDSHVLKQGGTTNATLSRDLSGRRGSRDLPEFVVMRTDLGPDELPLNADGSVDEGAEGMEEAGRIDRVDPDKTVALDLDLSAGSYVFFCNIIESGEEEGEEGEFVSHFALGMRTSFTVE